METLLLVFWWLKYPTRSKPTVWDGDKAAVYPSICLITLCSKPTLWDGDLAISSATEISLMGMFQAHRVV